VAAKTSVPFINLFTGFLPCRAHSANNPQQLNNKMLIDRNTEVSNKPPFSEMERYFSHHEVDLNEIAEHVGSAKF
jgi:hypothetical protein